MFRFDDERDRYLMREVLATNPWGAGTWDMVVSNLSIGLHLADGMLTRKTTKRRAEVVMGRWAEKDREARQA